MGESWYCRCMRYIGIDYGTKRIGLALSDEEGLMAYPHSVVQSGKTALDEILTICKNEEVILMVMGDSKSLDGTPNPLMEHVQRFLTAWKGKSEISVAMEPEYFSSHQAVKMRGKDAKHDKIDASAAAIILQSYLDKERNKKTS